MPFLTPFQEGTHHKLSSGKKSKFCKQGDGKLDYSRYSEVSLLTLYYHWQTFLLEMVIAKDPSYLSLQYFMFSVTVAYHLTVSSNNIGTHNETIIDNEFLSASIILLFMYQPKTYTVY